jgi:hypothetical protein
MIYLMKLNLQIESRDAEEAVKEGVTFLASFRYAGLDNPLVNLESLLHCATRTFSTQCAYSAIVHNEDLKETIRKTSIKIDDNSSVKLSCYSKKEHRLYSLCVTLGELYSPQFIPSDVNVTPNE